MFISLQRDSTIKEFLTQKFSDSTNNFPSWIIISTVICLLLSVFVSPFIPDVPKSISKWSIAGYEMNKFGFAFLSVSLFYLGKNVFTYIFYSGTGSIKKIDVFYFTSSKFYFCFSLILMVLCVANFFYEVNQLIMFNYMFVVFLLLFVFKLLYYLFHHNNILPEIWYYKFLYICTLQIVPILILWKLLFF